ncbi:MAG: glycosyltransferase family 2 protein [Deltaproteobacteria bacterium]|nr:glycosyltransferase family 2 protein [Deltaproteobacteria bacterium]
MYRNKKIGVVVPAYNEEKQIGAVVSNIPDWVDHIIIVNDASTDKTGWVVRQLQKTDSRVILIDLDVNQGCGGALASGYQWARRNECDIAVRMDGDGQMDPGELSSLLDPIVEKRADYTKGNRLFTGEAFKRIPKVRYFGNAFLSLLTKIASGYWHVADFQSGYTAINKRALHMIDWTRMYKRYGQPNDLLVRLNVYNFRVTDIPVEPVYNIGEKSGMKIYRVIFTLSWLLIKLFFWRMKEKYIIRDFHPLIFFYTLGGFFIFTTFALMIRVLYYKFTLGFFPPTGSLAAFFSFTSASLFTLFAMWFDMEANKELKGLPEIKGLLVECRENSGQNTSSSNIYNRDSEMVKMDSASYPRKQPQSTS